MIHNTTPRTRLRPVTPHEWPFCDVCGQAVAPGVGVLLIDMGEAWRAWGAQHDWDAVHPDGRIYSVADLCERPDDARWRWGHCDCLPLANVYDIAAQRIDTPAKALNWTLHLEEKRWYTATNWADTLRRLGLAGGGL